MNIRGIFLGIFFTVIMGIAFSGSAEAALLYIDPSSTEMSRGDTVTLALRIDTSENECINTIDVTVHYDASVRVIDVSRGDSIFSVWVEDPVIDEKARTVQFAGGIPGGYCGRVSGDPRLSNIVAELVVRAPGFVVGGEGATSKASVWLDESSQVLLHDGLGTPAQLSLLGAELSLLDTPGAVVDDGWNVRVRDDDVPPADFSITLTKDATAFAGKHFVVFNSLDKQSGIDHYEVVEEPFEEFDLFSWGAANAPWSEVTSPYVLKDQTLNSTIRIKAIDKAGNETISVLVPDEALRTLTTQRFVVTVVSVGIAFIVLVGLGYVLWRRKHKIEVEVLENEKNDNTS